MKSRERMTMLERIHYYSEDMTFKDLAEDGRKETGCMIVRLVGELLAFGNWKY